MAVLVQDTFTDSNGVSLFSHTPNVDTIGGGWTAYKVFTTAGTPAADIQSNKMRVTVALTGGVIQTNEPDVDVTVDYTAGAAANRGQVVLRASTDGNCWIVNLRETDSDVILVRVENNISTIVGTAAQTYTNGQTYNVRVFTNGATITVYINSVQKITTSGGTFNQTATKHGLAMGLTDSSPHWDNLLVVQSNSIAITTPTAYRTFQRNSSGLANIAITGTYVGTPSGIEARWNGGTWTAMGTVSGGNFSGTLSNQTQGQGTLEVRFTNDTGISASSAYVGIGDVFIVAGQSNASGYGTNNQSYSHATLKATMLGNDYNWKELVDPTDSKINQVDSVSAETGTPGGSVWPLLATLFMANQGVPCAFVPCAWGGADVLSWQPGANHEDRTTLYGSMNYRAIQTGVKVVLLHLGERDALIGTSQATYNSLLDSFANAVNTDSSVKVMACKLQNCTDRDETAVNAAIAEAWGDNSNVLTGPDFSDITPSVDGLHFKTDAELQEAADRWWATLQESFYSASNIPIKLIYYRKFRS